MNNSFSETFIKEPAKATILIVDDAPSNVQALAMLLKDDYKIMVATDGKRCIELATGDNIPDLILLDIEMPDINGYQVCQHLKNLDQSKNIPIIFITGKDAASDEEFGFNLGAVDYITKPVQPSIVKVRVKTQITIKQQNDMLIKMALHDQLTDLYNRYYLMDIFPQKISEALRHDQKLSLIMLDIDNFKHVNDNHGHDVGDIVLQALSKEITANLRNEDIAARLGGEEFIIVVSQCNLASALIKAEDLRAKIEALYPNNLSITCSIGVTELTEELKTSKALLMAVDKALYHAKNTGRNRVCNSNDLIE